MSSLLQSLFSPEKKREIIIRKDSDGVSNADTRQPASVDLSKTPEQTTAVTATNSKKIEGEIIKEPPALRISIPPLGQESAPTSLPLRSPRRLSIPEKPLTPRSQRAHDATSEAKLSQVTEEYERRLKAISVCLEEKAEENIELWKKLKSGQEQLALRDEKMKDLELQLETRNDSHRHLAEKLETAMKHTKHQEALVEEFSRRLQVLSMCLDEMAQENIALLKKLSMLSDSKEVARRLESHKKPMAEKIEEKARQLDASRKAETSSSNSVISQEEQLITDYFTVVDGCKDEKARALLERFQKALALEWETKKQNAELIQKQENELKLLRAAVSSAEEKLKSTTARLQKESDAKRSHMESCEKYEKRLRKLELKAKENLQKEGKRRQEAEYLASKLKKKVSELTFLLNEKADDDDDDESDADSSADSSRSSSPAPAVPPPPSTPPPPIPTSSAASSSAAAAASPAAPPASPAPVRKVALVAEEHESIVKVEKLIS